MGISEKSCSRLTTESATLVPTNALTRFFYVQRQHGKMTCMLDIGSHRSLARDSHGKQWATLLKFDSRGRTGPLLLMNGFATHPARNTTRSRLVFSPMRQLTDLNLALRSFGQRLWGSLIVYTQWVAQFGRAKGRALVCRFEPCPTVLIYRTTQQATIKQSPLAGFSFAHRAIGLM